MVTDSSYYLWNETRKRDITEVILAWDDIRHLKITLLIWRWTSEFLQMNRNLTALW